MADDEIKKKRQIDKKKIKLLKAAIKEARRTGKILMIYNGWERKGV